MDAIDAASAELRSFASPEELAEALAEHVAKQLAGALEARGKASLAVSGGKTPVRFFQALSMQPLDWHNIGVTLVDERLVPETDQRSNARLVQENLLVGNAAAARFLPLYSAAATPEQAARNAQSALSVSAFPFPLDVVILGMGADGHSASFFPDAPNLGELIENKLGGWVLPVQSKSAGEPRLTLSLQLLCAARFLALHIEGEEKKRVLQEALEEGDRPVSAFFDRAESGVQIYWAP
jgi:6-phosphogluconolactonase